ncbi:MAG: hypothetical protein N2691_02455 [Patescibacteria group bacterium]|nr:hypothetical protein [Patescibacteria group bacterium]
MKAVIFAGAILAGFAIPQAAEFLWLLKPLLMGLLFYAFLDIHLDRSLFHKQIPLVFAGNVGLSLVLYFAVAPFDRTLALALFSIAFAPTATAAPAIMFFLRGKVEFVIASVVFTNFAAALLLPFVFTGILVPGASISTLSILRDTAIVILVPFVLVQVTKLSLPPVYRFFDKHKEIALWILAAIIFLAVSNAGAFLHKEEGVSFAYVFQIGFACMALCLGLFTLGRRFGGGEFRREVAQSLAHKNTMFMAWFATTYLSPAVAMGPIFYLICDTLYNTWQISRTGEWSSKAAAPRKKPARSRRKTR